MKDEFDDEMELPDDELMVDESTATDVSVVDVEMEVEPERGRRRRVAVRSSAAGKESAGPAAPSRKRKPAVKKAAKPAAKKAAQAGRHESGRAQEAADESSRTEEEGGRGQEGGPARKRPVRRRSPPEARKGARKIAAEAGAQALGCGEEEERRRQEKGRPPPLGLESSRRSKRSIPPGHRSSSRQLVPEYSVEVAGSIGGDRRLTRQHRSSVLCVQTLRVRRPGGQAAGPAQNR